MADSPILPGSHQWKLVPNPGTGKPELPQEFFRFFRDLVTYVAQTQGNTASLADILARLDALEEASTNAVTGQYSVQTFQQDAATIIRLLGDIPAPAVQSYYGTDENGERGWLVPQPGWAPNPYADYLVDENGNYLTDESGNFLTSQDGFPIPLEYGGTGGDYSSVAANLVFASPDGIAGAPVFRALEEADIPPVYDPLGSAASALAAANAYTDSLEVSAGSFTPTLTNTTNLTSSTTGVGQWMKIGDTVNFSVRVAAQATTGSAGTPVATLLEVSLPVATNLTAVNQVAGNATIGEAPYVSGQVSSNTANDTLNVNWFATSTSNRAITITGTYRMTA